MRGGGAYSRDTTVYQQNGNLHCTMSSKVVLSLPAVLLLYTVYVPALSRCTVVNVMLVAVRATLLEEVIGTPFLDQVKEEGKGLASVVTLIWVFVSPSVMVCGPGLV